MNKFRNFISLYFNLSRKESNGFIILCGLMSVIFIAPALYRPLLSPTPSLLASDRKTLDSLILILDNHLPEKRNIHNFQSKRKQETVSYSTFNPNIDSEEKMTKSGVPGFISKRIIKFRSKGGKFKTKADVKKIYGLSETIFLQLSSFIKLPEETKTTKNVYNNVPGIHEKKSRSVFDINKADSLQLVSLKGIGPTFTSRILKYRNKLGGFISKEQLKEVYGLDSTALQEIGIYTITEQNFIPIKININDTNAALLQSHPYIGKKTAQLIISYRNQHGNYISVDQLKNIKAISEERYLKMVPYLTIE
jgi:competence protein ComEA